MRADRQYGAAALAVALSAMVASGRKLRGRGGDLDGAPTWVKAEYEPKYGKHSQRPYRREREIARMRRQAERRG